MTIVIVLILVFLEAVFVAAEIALVTVRRSRIDQLVDEGDSRAHVVQRLTSHPGRFLAVIQIGITFVSLLASAYAAESQVTDLGNLLGQIAVLEPYKNALALIIVTALISLITILFGELIPKTIALAHPEPFALGAAGPIEWLGRVFAPLVWLLNSVTTAVTKPLGAGSVDRDAISTEELKILVERGGEQGILEAEEEQMISAVMELRESHIHEVMVPRIDIVAVPTTAPLDELVDTIVEAGHSRIPVYEESVDNIVGLLYAKDLLPYLKGPDQPPELRTLLRTPLFVPESMSIDDLLHEFQRRKVHIAIVLDEYGGTAGIVTIEDLLEEIVGEIQDEYDVEEPMVERLSDDEIRLDGRAAIDQLAEAFDTQLGLEDEDEYDTVGGLIYHRVGGIPAPGDQVQVNGLKLTVESTDGRRVSKVLVVREKLEEGEPAGVDDADR